jgi:hypothetical protein
MATTDRAVLIRYMRDGKPRRGSGLRVAGRFVLTADHCANGTGHVLVAGGVEYPAEVYARSGSTDVDVALLEAPTAPAVEPLRCAVVDQTVARVVAGCRALGFPVWKDRENAPRVAHVPGNIPTAEGVNPQAEPNAIAPMSLKITQSDIRAHPVPLGDVDQAGSPWAGMSGAVVITAEDLIVGVICGHSPAEGSGSLTATRMEAVAYLPSEVAQKFLSALQMPNPQEWPMVPPPAGQGNEVHGKPERERPLSPAELEVLRPRIAADRVARMLHNDAVNLLATASVRAAAARVLEVFLTRDKGRDKGLAIRLLADIDQSIAEELIAAIPSADPLLRNLPKAVEAIADCEDNADVELGEEIKWLRLAAPSIRSTQGYFKAYEKGLIHWCDRDGAQPTSGEICAYHVAKGGSGSRLGFPLTPESQAGTSSPFGTPGRFQRFESRWNYGQETCRSLGLNCGATVYSSKHGVYTTWGGIGEYYENIGGTNGPLGFPLTEEIEVGPIDREAGDGAVGWYQRFEGGVVYWSEKTESIAVHPPVSDYRDGHADLGFPVSPLMKAATPEQYGTEGRFQRFEVWQDYPEDILGNWSDSESPGGATVYTSDAHGTYCVGWGNGVLYELLGGTSSWLGFPTSDETDARESEQESRATIQRFEGGAKFNKAENGSVPVPSAVMKYLSQHDDLIHWLGFPVKEADLLAQREGEQVQFFEHGVVTVRDGVPEAWVRPDDSLPPIPDEVDILGLEFRPATVAPGEIVDLEYRIRSASHRAFPVALGASLVAANGDEYFERAGDRFVRLTPGEGTYSRGLRVPLSVPDGSYRLIGAVWYPRIGRNRLAKLDCGFVVTVKAADG